MILSQSGAGDNLSQRRVGEREREGAGMAQGYDANGDHDSDVSGARQKQAGSWKNKWRGTPRKKFSCRHTFIETTRKECRQILDLSAL